MLLTIRPLSEPSRLREIYRLRVTAWEHSTGGTVINHDLFPDGWTDELDEDARHWTVTDDTGRIVASARLNIFDHPEQFPDYRSLLTLPVPSETPFAFCSRLVVHPSYRGRGLSTGLLRERLAYCEAHGVAWASAYVTLHSVKAKLREEGFGAIGEIDVRYHQDTPTHKVEVFGKRLAPVRTGRPAMETECAFV